MWMCLQANENDDHSVYRAIFLLKYFNKHLEQTQHRNAYNFRFVYTISRHISQLYVLSINAFEHSTNVYWALYAAQIYYADA